MICDKCVHRDPLRPDCKADRWQLDNKQHCEGFEDKTKTVEDKQREIIDEAVKALAKSNSFIVMLSLHADGDMRSGLDEIMDENIKTTIRLLGMLADLDKQ